MNMICVIIRATKAPVKSSVKAIDAGIDINNGPKIANIILSPIPAKGPIIPVLIPLISSGSAFCSSKAATIPKITVAP